MKYRYKVLEYRRQQRAYIDYLDNHKGETLSIAKKVKLCSEIGRLQFNIDRIEAMPFSDVEKHVQEADMHFVSALVKPKIKKEKPIPYTFSTWKQSS